MQPAPAVSRESLVATRPFVIINPVAGKGRGTHTWPAIREELRSAGLALKEAEAEQPMHAWSLAEDAARQGYDLIVSVGGDGTTHEVINGILRGRPDLPPVLAVIPAGTGNDFARCLNIPHDPLEAARLLLHGTKRRVDVGQVNNRYFATISGVGFDAEVAHQVNRWRGFNAEVAHQVNRWPRWAGGTTLYVAGILKMLATYSPVECRITIDGEVQVLKMFLLAAANTNWYGGGMYMAPHARIDDGLLAVVYARDLGKMETLAVLPKVYSGAHLTHPKVSHTMAREVRVESATPLAIHADGESVGHVPATFRAIPGALEVVVPT